MIVARSLNVDLVYWRIPPPLTGKEVTALVPEKALRTDRVSSEVIIDGLPEAEVIGVSEFVVDVGPI